MERILQGLNPAQEAAVTSEAAVLQVLAPPGSGKTKTLTTRAAYLIAHHGYEPRNIIVCTFTNKAAREMQERICSFVGKDVAKRLVLGTFHSIARRLLSRHGKLIGLPSDFGIADTSDTKSILGRNLKRLKCALPPAMVRSRISKLKSEAISSDDFRGTAKHVDQQEIARVYSEYEEHLRVSNLLDFDDLVLRCVELLRRYPGCVSHIEAVLIDEFQDTNNVQYELMELFAQARERITIVGDPDQSIYGWRNAEIKNLHKMKQRFPETHVITLEENYRSSGSILIAAQEIIEQDRARPQKKLSATLSIGIQPVLRRLPNPHVEAAWLVSEIQRTAALTSGLFSWSDYAVLLRSAVLSRQIETALGKAGIPYRMVGGHRFFDRVEVKLVLDYLRVISLPSHNDAVARVINVPARGIGEKTVQYLLEEAEEDKVSLWTVITNCAQGKKKLTTQLSRQAEQGILTFFNLIARAKSKLERPITEDESLAHFFEYIIRKIELLAHIKKLTKQDPGEFESRWSNVQELMTQAQEFIPETDPSEVEEVESQLVDEDDRFNIETSLLVDHLSKFLANVALATDATITDVDCPPKAQVTLSTIHAAKGLEWPVVFVPSAYEGSIPHSRAEDNDEERRLLFVAMTRAQSMLYLSCPTRSSNNEKVMLSSFLSEVPQDSFFAKCGPELKFEDVKQVAAILRRNCPSPALIEAIPATLEHTRDNQWPLSGEYKEEERRSWELGANIDEAEYDERAKRRKAEHGGFITAHRSYSHEKKTSLIQTAAGSTMNNTQTYSTAAATLSSGFISASRVPIVKEPEDLRVVSSNITAMAKVSRKQNMPDSTQGSIKTYFTAPSSEAAVGPRCITEKNLHTPIAPLRDITAGGRANISHGARGPSSIITVSADCTVDVVKSGAVEDVPVSYASMKPASTFHTTTGTHVSFQPAKRRLGMGHGLKPFVPVGKKPYKCPTINSAAVPRDAQF